MPGVGELFYKAESSRIIERHRPFEITTDEERIVEILRTVGRLRKEAGLLEKTQL
jgi:hypothetical protein